MAMPGNDESDKLLRIEAEEAMKEVKFAVRMAEVSSVLPHSQQLVYMNLHTKEDELYCVQLSIQGFRIVGQQFDTVEESQPLRYFETIYALLDAVSPKYRQSFGDALMDKLAELQKEQDQESWNADS